MSGKLTIRIDCTPIAWARPGQGPHGRYDTQKQVKDKLGLFLRPKLTKHTTFTGPVALKAIFVFPFSDTKKGHAHAGEFHIFKPDLDNLLKFYCDLCKDNGVYKDDCQICSIKSIKKYTTSEEDFDTYAVLTFREISPKVNLEEEYGNIGTEPGGIRVS